MQNGRTLRSELRREKRTRSKDSCNLQSWEISKAPKLAGKQLPWADVRRLLRDGCYFGFNHSRCQSRHGTYCRGGPPWPPSVGNIFTKRPASGLANPI